MLFADFWNGAETWPYLFPFSFPLQLSSDNHISSGGYFTSILDRTALVCKCSYDIIVRRLRNLVSVFSVTSGIFCPTMRPVISPSYAIMKVNTFTFLFDFREDERCKCVFLGFSSVWFWYFYCQHTDLFLASNRLSRLSLHASKAGAQQAKSSPLSVR